MTAQHTKGPWADKCKDGKFLGGKSSFEMDYQGKKPVATCLPIMAGKQTIALAVFESNSYCGDDAELKANARLIAAAPDLLEALEELEAAVCKHKEVLGTENPAPKSPLAKARAAIAKARGQK